VYCHGWCIVMGGVLSWVVYCHGWCIVMGGVLTWVVYCHGWCTLMGGVLSWVVYCHGWCIVMGGVLSWVVYCHGWCIVMQMKEKYLFRLRHKSKPYNIKLMFVSVYNSLQSINVHICCRTLSVQQSNTHKFHHQLVMAETCSRFIL